MSRRSLPSKQFEEALCQLGCFSATRVRITKWAELLRSHLRPLETANYVTAFIDGEIEPGSNWNEEIRNQLANADVFLAITSVNLLNSDTR